MTPPRVYKVEAIVLRGSDFGEADRLLTLYTRERGKIRAIAKGACRPGSKLAGHTQVLSYSLMTLARGRNLDIITQAQTIQSFPSLHDDLERLSQGLYLAELVESFTPEESENRALFELLRRSLEHLDRGRDKLVLVLFELRLLKFSGYLPELEKCLKCRCSLTGEIGYFIPSEGGVFCYHCRPPEIKYTALSAPSRKAMDFLLKASFQEVSRLRLTGQQLEEIERATKEHITFILERRPRVRVWLEQLSGSNPFAFTERAEYNRRC